MKDKVLSEIKPYLLDGYLIISLHPDWVNKFGKIPSFTVDVDDDRKLHLISNEGIKH
jgi:hypothetical protein